MKNRYQYFFLAALSFTLQSCQSDVEETKPVKQDVVEYVFASGTLKAKDEYTLTALTDGYISSLAIEENDQLQQGQVVATIDNEQNSINTSYARQLLAIANRNASSSAPALEEVKARIKMAAENVAFDSANVARYKKLLEANSISAATYEQVENQYKKSVADLAAAQQQYQQLSDQAKKEVVVNQSQQASYSSMLENNKVRALAPGTVLHKLKNTGDFVQKGEAIAIIGNVSSMYVQADVDESNISRVSKGQRVLYKLNAQDDTVYNGIVSEILPTFNEEKQSFGVKIIPGSVNDLALVNAQVQVNIEVGVAKNALLIPRRFINYADEVNVKGNKEPVKIHAKYVSTEWVQVLSGITDSAVLVLNKIPAK